MQQLRTKQYSLLAGQTLIGDAALANRTIIRVQREGVAYRRNTFAAPGRYYLNLKPLGWVKFVEPAAPGGEKVTIIYKV